MGTSELHSGRYGVRGVLGEGAQGVTFEAFDRSSGRLVAIKRFNVAAATAWKDVELAEREARVLATLDHPLVPRYVEHFEEGGALYLVMEKVEGETLDAILKRHGALPEDEVRRFLACADNALTYLHGRAAPIVHRDVKPRNIVRRPDGSYVLVDFGTVSERMRPRGGSTVVGTYGYMAPEQLHGRALPATDVYAVGATALAALTGAEPDTLPTRGLRIDARKVLQGRVSEPMITSLERMLEPDPEQRASNLHAALAAGPVPTHPLGASPPAALPPHDDVAVAKSIRKLLWALWGLGWVIVPIVITKTHQADKAWVPIILFGWMAANLILGWHKGALIRFLIRELRETGQPRVAAVTSTKHFRVDDAPAPQVRIQTPSLLPEEQVGQTQTQAQRQMQGFGPELARRAR
jgi:serine/threonine protein kinase